MLLYKIELYFLPAILLGAVCVSVLVVYAIGNGDADRLTACEDKQEESG